jgi:MoaA/NifB/PqqE/SkfB family radical SAM enzyme
LGEQGSICVTQNGDVIDRCGLRKGWQKVTVKLPVNTGPPTFEVSPLPVIENDKRELGLMIRSIVLFNDEALYFRTRQVAENSMLNESEFHQGAPVLDSFPQNLRVTTEVRCNIPETSQPCAYCAWDWSKKMEDGSPAFDSAFIEHLAGFYDNALQIVDCSIGEPVMNKKLAAIVSRFEDDSKEFSFTTNGQLLTARQRAGILGKNIELYVSIDAFSAEGFKRYRNNQYNRVISNIRALCAEKRSHKNLPRVTVSWIAMRSNKNEIEPYLDLMKDVGVDRVKLRSLYLDSSEPVSVLNNGYRFNYAGEVLSADELRDLSDRARRLAAARDLVLYVEWDEFERDDLRVADEPICAEPWKTFYVLARGIFPCCYGTEPIAKWQDQGDRSIAQFLRDTFNSPGYQNIRSELAAGRLAEYCLNTPSCPLLKRMNGERECGTGDPAAAPQTP